MKPKILIIEDDTFIAELIAKILSKENFDVDLAFDGEVGLKKIKTQTPDLILLDLVIPGISGFEILKKVKKESKTKKIPVIIISNLGTPEEVQKGLQLGADAYLIKSNSLPDDLLKKMREILQGEKLKGRIFSK